MLNIKQRQMNLKFLNFYSGKVDGIEGIKTKEAYKKFQQEYGLAVDGIYGVNTDNKLIAVIKDIQTKIGTVVDGVAGDNTIAKCKEYQRNNGLAADGICGVNTRAKLNQKTDLNWDNIKYFKKSEFTCKCGCGLNNIDLKLVKILEKIREHYNKPLVVTSGCRCKKKNDSLKGSSPNSRHLYGKASDIYVQGVSTNELLQYTKGLVNSRELRYTYTNNSNMTGAVHVDIV